MVNALKKQAVELVEKIQGSPSFNAAEVEYLTKLVFNATEEAIELVGDLVESGATA